MEDFEDRDLKDLFGKLDGYESKVNGVSWKSVETRLTNVTSRSWRGASALLITGALLFMSWEGSENALPSVDSPQSTQSNKVLQVNTPMLIPTLMEPKHKTIATVVQKEEEVKPIGRTAAPFVPELPSFDVAVPQSFPGDYPLERNQENGAPKRRMLFALDSYYLFGFVNPLSGDGVRVQNYISKPGAGLSLSASMPLRMNGKNKLYLSSSLSVFHKNYDFEVSEFFSERAGFYRHQGSGIVTYAGVGITWTRQDWQASGLVHIRASGNNVLFAKNLVSLSLRKDLLQFGNSPYALTIGSTLMVPLANEAHYLRFTPVLIGVGVRRK